MLAIHFAEFQIFLQNKRHKSVAALQGVRMTNLTVFVLYF